MRNINFTYDLDSMKQNIEAIMDDLNAKSIENLKYAAKVYANAAAKNTYPAPLGKPTIEKKFYERPWYFLPKLIKGEYGVQPSQIDLAQYKKGMLYKILNTKGRSRKSNIAYAYCKTPADLKRLIHIDTRGLARVMWGKNLEQIGVDVPVEITRLMNKAKKLQALPYNTNTLVSENDVHTASLTNNASNIDSAGKEAEKRADYVTSKALNTKMAKEAEKERQI